MRDLRKERQEDDARFTTSLAGLAAALFLAVIGLYLLDALAAESKARGLPPPGPDELSADRGFGARRLTQAAALRRFNDGVGGLLAAGCDPCARISAEGSSP